MYARASRPGRKGTGGFTLVDVVLALAIVAVGVLGVLTLLLGLRSRNDASSANRLAMRACQEVMELAIAESQVLPIDVWAARWNNRRFQPLKIVKADFDVRDERAGRVTPEFVGRERTNVGRVTVVDISEEDTPNTLYEITVAVDTGDTPDGASITPQRVRTQLVTRRSRP